MTQKYPIDFIGNTPLIELSAIVPRGGARLFGKLELMNPGGSIKDRPAKAMLQDALERGWIKPGMTVVEPTAGNTGIGIALVSHSMGCKSVSFVPDRISREKYEAIKLFGGEVHLVPRVEGIKGCIQRSEDYMNVHKNCYMPQQFENPSNPLQAEKILAVEIEKQLGYLPDGMAFGAGSGGTFTGVARYFKKQSSKVQCWVVQPEGSVFKGGAKKEYQVEGIGNSYVPANLDLSLADDIATIPDTRSFQMCGRLRDELGLLVGGSSGANVTAAIELCRALGPGKRVVTLLCDGLERYRSKDWVKKLLGQKGSGQLPI